MEEQNTASSPLGTEYIDHDQAMQYLHCQRTKFFRMRKRHQIPHYRHGGDLYFLKTDLDAYLRGLKATLSKD